MHEREVPYQRMIFICTNVRDGEAACGNANRGEHNGFKLVELMRDEVKKRGLKGKVRVAKSGCFDLCAQGPCGMTFRKGEDHVFLHHLTTADLPQFFEKYLKPIS